MKTVKTVKVVEASKTGVMYVTIKVMFDQDVPIEKAEEFVREMDYTITSQTQGVSIQDTEVFKSEPGILS